MELHQFETEEIIQYECMEKIYQYQKLKRRWCGRSTITT